MKKLSLFGLLAGLTVFAALLPATASASETQCNNQTLGAVTVQGNIVVPPGAFCDLLGTHVTGNATVKKSTADSPAGLLENNGAVIDGQVQVEANGQFAAFNGSTVGGDVHCDKCQLADVQSSTVNGSLQDEGLTQGAFIENSSIGGNLQIHGSLDGGFGFALESNSVGGQLDFSKNTGASDISGNTIGKNLTCKDNTPPPTGGGNTAKKKDGQCALL